jgi:hypothetical protein
MRLDITSQEFVLRRASHTQDEGKIGDSYQSSAVAGEKAKAPLFSSWGRHQMQHFVVRVFVFTPDAELGACNSLTCGGVPKLELHPAPD